MDVVEVRLLGPLLVRRADGTIVRKEEWRTAKTLDLLRLLALNVEHPLPVASIIERLWPGVDWDHGRASLRTAASQLRKVLKVDCIDRQPGCLGLIGVWVDVSAFQRLAREVELARRGGDHQGVVDLVRKAEALYSGDVEVTSGEWETPFSERLRELRLRVLLDGAAAAESCGWMRDSVDLAGLAKQVEFTEEVARALMRAHAGLGETDRALRVYEALRRDLVDRLGVDPAPQTRALHMLVLSGTAALQPRLRPVGVDGVVSEVVRSARRILEAPTAPDVVWLCGEPGSGRLTVASLVADELDLPMYDLTGLPFEAYSDGLLDGGDGSDPGVIVLPCRSLPPSWAVNIVHALAARYPGVILVRSVAPPPSNGTKPSGDAVVTVGALAPGDFETLARMLFQGELSTALMDRLRLESAGLAGAACRIARTWMSQGQVVWHDGGLNVATPRQPVDERIADPATAAGVRRLDVASRDALSALAVAESALTVDDIGTVLSGIGGVMPPRDLLDHLVDAGFAQVGPEGYRLSDPGLGDLLVGWMRPSVRLRLEEGVHALESRDVSDGKKSGVRVPHPRGAREPRPRRAHTPVG